MGEVSSHGEDGWMKGWEPWGALGRPGGCMWVYVGDEQAPQGSGVASPAPAPGPGMGFDFCLSPSVRRVLLFWDGGLLRPPYLLNYCVIC